jgi:DNA replication protein DnaC
MKYIRQNPYRIIGLLSNTSEKEISRQKGKLTKFISVGKEISCEFDYPFLLGEISRNAATINQVFSLIEQGQDKVSDENRLGYGYIDVYSYTMDMETLRCELNNIVKNYLIKMTNKLGNNIYYFSEMPTIVYRDLQGRIDSSKLPECIHFTMKPFVTNRSFKNLFGKNINIIRKRLEFFRDNKDWYDDKGVPYTLGILISGAPGSGKTSIIKCIANEMRRHIINIHLSDTMTKSQIENLFYNEQIHVTQNGKTDTYTIPINKRIYVLEDVDCQCDIILDRGNETAEQVLARKNAELKQEIEKLKFALSEMSNGKKMVMTGSNSLPPIESKKDDGSNEKITLSFLLNLFDGVLETPGRITFMTTNFIDKLDKAFTRPGRIDVIGKFGFADHSQLIAIIEHRYDTKLTDEQINIIYNTHQCITPAEVSRILFENFNDLDGALEGLINYADEYMEKKRLEKEKDEELKMKVAALQVQSQVGMSRDSTAIDIDNISQESSDSEEPRAEYKRQIYTDIVSSNHNVKNVVTGLPVTKHVSKEFIGGGTYCNPTPMKRSFLDTYYREYNNTFPR